MKTQNLYIFENNPLVANNLEELLKKRFDNYLTISTFLDRENLLKKIDHKTAIVLLNYDLKGEKGDKLLLDIKKINPTTEVIIVSSDEEIGTAIDNYRKGATSVVYKGKNSIKRIYSIVHRIIYYPVEVIKRFFGLKELGAIFVLEILYIGLFVFLGMLLFT